MSKKDIIEFEIIFSFQDFLHNKINLETLIGSSDGIKKLKKIVSSICNSNEPISPLKRLLVGAESKTITAHAFVNSLRIKKVTYIVSSCINLASSKHLFRNSTADSALIMANVNNLNKLAEGIILQYLKLGYYKYENRQTKQQEVLSAKGFLILTSENVSGVNKRIVDAVDFIIELEPYDDSQMKFILEQRLKFMEINFNSQVLNLMLSRCCRIHDLMNLLKLAIINMMADSRNQLKKEDVKWAIENIK